jgi:aminoglycoside/choline kinase family phosphotransferase
MSTEDKKELFMQALDAWMDVNVIAPLLYSESAVTEDTIVQIKKSMRTKVLDSYHNGRRTAGGAVRREPNHEAGTRRPMAPAVAVVQR